MNPKFKILVINLDSSEDRLLSMGNQLAELGMDFERIAGVRGSELSEEEKSAVYDRQVNIKKYYKLLNDGEIGCYLSHVRCYEKIVSDQLDFALILEDDAILTPDIVKFIDQIDCLEKNWDYVKLSHGRKQKDIQNTTVLIDNLAIGNTAKLPSTTTGQFVSLNGASKLIKHALPVARPIDIDIQYWFEKELKCLVVRPFPVLNGDFGSEINVVEDRRLTQKSRWRRILQKVNYEWNLFRHRNKIPSIPNKR